jgi:hypothetical protein
MILMLITSTQPEDRENTFTQSGNAIAKMDMLRLPVTNRPFRVVSFPERIKDPAIQDNQTRFLIVWFEETVEPKLFELPLKTVVEFEKLRPTFQQRWMFKIEGVQLFLNIVPYSD